jgi:hypothetical protein
MLANRSWVIIGAVPHGGNSNGISVQQHVGSSDNSRDTPTSSTWSEQHGLKLDKTLMERHLRICLALPLPYQQMGVEL